jgi:RNA polymerase sigma-70 factor (ECF subfamily)
MSTCTADDRTLIHRCRCGDRDAFAELVRRYERFAVGIALHVLRDPHLAGDVAQDVFLKVHRALNTLREDRNLRAWIGSIAHKTAVDYLRRSRRQSLSLEAILESSTNEIPEPRCNGNADGVSRAVRELLMRVFRAFDGLPLKYQTILYLRDIRGRSIGEIQTRLGLSRTATLTRLCRARKTLRRRVAQWSGAPAP